MTYLTFHLVFLLPPIALLAAGQPRPPAGRGRWRARWAIPLMALVALLYTTPWDNYLLYRDVWSYGPGRVLLTIGYVPVEEYLFFALQPVLTGLALYYLLGRKAWPVPPSPGWQVRFTGALFYLLLALLGALLLFAGPLRSLYLGLILAWAAPVLAFLWAFSGHVMWQMRGVFFAAVAGPTLYLWIADAIALRLGIWHITGRTSLGIDPLGLPVEEAVFFLVTNLLVVQGLLLFLSSEREPTP